MSDGTTSPPDERAAHGIAVARRRAGLDGLFCENARMADDEAVERGRRASRQSADLIVGGWVVVRPVAVPSWLSLVGVPELLTVSDCIQEDLPRPEPWFGDWFHDPHEAQDRAQSVPGPDPLVVTVALPADLADQFMSEVAEGSGTWFKTLRRRAPLPSDVELLGFEVVGAETCLDFHSWHCHGYAAEVSDALGIRVNPLGLIPTSEEARRVLGWMLERPMDEAPEPVAWTVVALAASGR
jgi:hypothetical protein